jgi:hypothetical protein
MLLDWGFLSFKGNGSAVLTLVLDGDGCSGSGPGRFTSGTRWVGGWVDTAAKRKKKKHSLSLPGIERSGQHHAAYDLSSLNLNVSN